MSYHFADQLGFHVRNDADARVIDEIVLQKAYERPRLGFGLRSGECWLDLGANIGAFSVWASRKRGAHVIAVEPIAENIALLKQNVALNKANVEVLEGAVGVTPGEMTLRYNTNTPARSSALVVNGVSRTVPVFGMTDLIATYQPHGIKMDIEGGEFPILESGFPLDSIRAVALEYHFRFDKNCHASRRRIAFLDKHFRYQSVHPQVYSRDRWAGWQDHTMFFWN
jgi:FkbM family methyltransferase